VWKTARAIGFTDRGPSLFNRLKDGNKGIGFDPARCHRYVRVATAALHIDLTPNYQSAIIDLFIHPMDREADRETFRPGPEVAHRSAVVWKQTMVDVDTTEFGNPENLVFENIPRSLVDDQIRQAAFQPGKRFDRVHASAPKDRDSTLSKDANPLVSKPAGDKILQQNHPNPRSAHNLQTCHIPQNVPCWNPKKYHP